MKKHWFAGLLGLEAIACAAAALGGAPWDWLGFPYVQLGQGLRALSLSGAGGNAAAWAAYVLVGLLPLGYLAAKGLRRGLKPEDGLLAGYSVLLVISLYGLINPGLLPSGEQQGLPGEWYGLMLAGCLHSMLLGYLVLRLLRGMGSEENNRLIRYVRLLMGALCGALVYGIFGQELGGLAAAWQELGEANTGAGRELWVSYLVIVLQSLLRMLPYGLDLALLRRGFLLAAAWQQDRFSPEVARAAEGMGRLCRRAVAAMMLAQAALNLLQLLLGSLARQTSYTVWAPLSSILLGLALLILARYFQDSGRIKREQDLFV